MWVVLGHEEGVRADRGEMLLDENIRASAEADGLHELPDWIQFWLGAASGKGGPKEGFC